MKNQGRALTGVVVAVFVLAAGGLVAWGAGAFNGSPEKVEKVSPAPALNGAGGCGGCPTMDGSAAKASSGACPVTGNQATGLAAADAGSCSGSMDCSKAAECCGGEDGCTGGGCSDMTGVANAVSGCEKRAECESKCSGDACDPATKGACGKSCGDKEGCSGDACENGEN